MDSSSDDTVQLIRDVQVSELKSLPKGREIYKQRGKIFLPISKPQAMAEIKAEASLIK
jgi:chaperonin cofactor prefoldin